MNKKHWLILILVFILLILFDQFTKNYAELIPNYQRWGYLNFNLKYNSGVFLGFFKDLATLIRVVAISTLGTFIIFIYVSLQYFLTGRFLFFRHGLNFFVAGLLGNLTDRIVRGHIIDFLALGKGRFKTPVFNFADVFLWIGVMIVLYVLLFDNKGLFPEASKRKKYIINKEFQYKHTFTFVIISCAFCLMNLVLSFTFFSYAADEQLAYQIAPLFKGYLLLFIVFSLLFLIFIFCIGIITSNRIAGPIYALKRFIVNIKEGEAGELKLREDDDFKELEGISKEILSLFKKRD